MDHHHHHKFWFVAAIAGAVALALTERPLRAHAQWLNDSDSGAAASPISEPSVGPGAESVNGAEAEAIPPDATGDSVDDSTAYPVSANSETASASFRGPLALDDESGSASKNDAVLEIPQVIDPAGAETPDQSGNAEQATGGDEDEAAQSSQAGEQTATDDNDLAAEANQVGTLEDYENQASAAPSGPIFFAPGIRIVQFPRLPALNGFSSRRLGIPMATSPIILPPTSSAPFPSTSPMLIAPRIGTLGAFPREGLMRFRR